MPEHEHDALSLDRAFAALAADLAHSPAPGAAAAVSTARRHRRNRVGAVALAAVVALGGGLALPGVVSPDDDGVAAGGGSVAQLDATALDRATAGWVDGWEVHEPGTRYEASLAGASCFAPREPSVAGDSRGTSWWDTTTARATVTILHYGDASSAGTAAQEVQAPDGCGTATTSDVDGARVRHEVMEPDLPDTYLTDRWVVLLGSDVATLEIATEAGPAPAAVAERVAEALVAGLRSGETQETSDRGLDQGLTTATVGWTDTWQKPRTQGDPGLAPLNDGCMDIYGPGKDFDRVASHLFTSADGAAAHLMYVEYDAPAAADDFVTTFSTTLEACGATPAATPAANGVVVHGAIDGEATGDYWLVVEGDRAAMLVVAGAATADPRPEAATAFLEQTLQEETSFAGPTWW